MGTKRTRDEKDGHLARLESAILRGTPVSEAVRAYAAEAGVTERQGWKDAVAVRRSWGQRSAAATETIETEVGRAVARRELLFTEALAAGDLQTALAADQDRCRLLNLYGAKPGHATGEAGSVEPAADK